MGSLNLFGRVSLNASPFQATVRGMKSTVAGLGKDINSALGSKVAAMVSVASIAAMTRRIVEHIERVKDLSDQYDVTTDAVQKLNFAAGESGQQAEAVLSKLDILATKRKEAALGNAEIADAFTRLGVTLDDLQDPAQTTLDLFTKLGSSTTATAQTDFVTVLGKNAGKLRAVADDFRKTQESAPLIDAYTIKRVDELTRAIEKLKLEAIAFGATAAGFTFDQMKTGIERGDAANKAGFVAEMLKPVVGAGLDGLRSLIKKKPLFTPEEDQAEVAKLARDRVRLEEKLAEVVSRAAKEQMSADQRRAAILQEIAREEAGIADAQEFGAENAVLRSKIRIQELRGELNNVEANASRQSGPERAASDSMISIGNFLGDRVNGPQIKKMDEQLRVLREISADIKKKGNGLDVPL